jgi:hypothetical protein
VIERARARAGTKEKECEQQEQKHGEKRGTMCPSPREPSPSPAVIITHSSLLFEHCPWLSLTLRLTSSGCPDFVLYVDIIVATLASAL